MCVCLEMIVLASAVLDNSYNDSLLEIFIFRVLDCPPDGTTRIPLARVRPSKVTFVQDPVAESSNFCKYYTLF